MTAEPSQPPVDPGTGGPTGSGEGRARRGRYGTLALAALGAVLGVWIVSTLVPARRPAPPAREPGSPPADNARFEYDAPEPGTYSLPPLKPAGDGRVLDTEGRAASLREIMRGRITVLSFIYTRCADATACPMATGVLRELHAASREDSTVSNALRLVTLSFDSEFDTPAVMARYAQVRGESGGAPWLFLTAASSADLKPLLERYGQQVNRKPDPNDPLGPYYHLLRVYLIDRAGTIRNIYSTGFLDPRLVLADVRTLMLEEKARPS